MSPKIYVVVDVVVDVVGVGAVVDVVGVGVVVVGVGVVVVVVGVAFFSVQLLHSILCSQRRFNLKATIA